jgi:hypothetical protein
MLAHLAKREQNPFEERSRLVQPLLQRIVQMHIQLPAMLSNVLSDIGQHDALEEYARLLRLEVRDEDFSRDERGLGRPVLGRCEREIARPLVVRGEDFEDFRDRTGLVSTALEKLADPGREEGLLLEYQMRVGHYRPFLNTHFV